MQVTKNRVRPGGVHTRYTRCIKVVLRVLNGYILIR